MLKDRIPRKGFISSLQGVEIIEDRQVGNSTKIIDNAIDLIFQGYQVIIEDHCNKRILHNLLFKKVIARLLFEHQLEYMLENKQIIINEAERTISLNI